MNQQFLDDLFTALAQEPDDYLTQKRYEQTMLDTQNLMLSASIKKRADSNVIAGMAALMVCTIPPWRKAKGVFAHVGKGSTAMVTLDDELYFNPYFYKCAMDADPSGQFVLSILAHEAMHIMFFDCMTSADYVEQGDQFDKQAHTLIGNVTSDLRASSNPDQYAQVHWDGCLEGIKKTVLAIKAKAEEEIEADKLKDGRGHDFIDWCHAMDCFHDSTLPRVATRIKSHDKPWLEIITAVADKLRKLSDMLEDDGGGGGGDDGEGDGEGDSDGGEGPADQHTTPDTFDDDGNPSEMSKGEREAQAQAGVAKRQAALEAIDGASEVFGEDSLKQALEAIIKPPTLSLAPAILSVLKQGTGSYDYPETDDLFTDLVMPGRVSRAANVVLVLDTSGSVVCDERTLGRLIGEMIGSLDEANVSGVRLMTCEYEVELDTGDYTLPLEKVFDTCAANLTGGGGTGFDAPFERLYEEGEQPDLLVYFTDGYGRVSNWDGVAKETIWVTTGDTDFGFGTAISVTLGE